MKFYVSGSMIDDFMYFRGKKISNCNMKLIFIPDELIVICSF